MNRFVVLGMVVLVLAGIWTGAWFWAAGMATSYVQSLETADGVSTPRLSCDQFAITGFPFGFDATCTGATIVSLDTTVTVAGLKASVLVYNPFHVLAFAQSPVTMDNALTGSRSRLDFAEAEASARLSGWRIGRVSLVVDKPVWNDTILEDRLIADADLFELHLVDDPDKHDAKAGLASLAEFVKVEGLSAPRQKFVDAKATLEAEISNLPDDVRVYGDPDLLKRWQGAGGKFNLVGVDAADGEDFYRSSGTLGLDSQGRIEGQLKVTSRGVVERLATMIPDNAKGLVLGGQAEDGSYSQTINFAAGMVMSGVIPMGFVPPVW